MKEFFQKNESTYNSHESWDRKVTKMNHTVSYFQKEKKVRKSQRIAN